MVDAIASQEAGEFILDIFAEELQKKGYPINKAFQTSVGMSLNSNLNYRLIISSEDQKKDLEDLPLRHPPFLISRTYQKDSELKQALARLYKVTMELPYQRKDRPYAMIPDVTLLGNEEDGEVILSIFYYGYTVPLRKQISQGLLTAALSALTFGAYTGHGMAMYETGTTGMYVVMFDAKTGEAIWADYQYDQPDKITKKLVRKMATKIIRNIP